MQKSEDVSKGLSVTEELKKACKKPYCRRLSTLKNCLDGDLVSFPSFRFLLRELKTHKIAFCIRVSAIVFLLLRLQCFVQPAKNYPDPLLIA